MDNYNIQNEKKTSNYSYLDERNYSNYDNNGDSEEVVSMGAWVGIIILLAIPFVNIITIFVLAFGTKNQNLRNFGKATLLIAGIVLAFGLLFGACSY